MKKIKIFLSLIFLIFFLKGYGQDMIFLKRGELIKARISQKTEAAVIYQLYESTDTVFHQVNIYEIATIRYENGKVEIIQINNRKIKPWGLLFNLWGPAIALGISLEYFINPSWVAEAGFDLVGVHAGFRYHLFGNEVQLWTPYIGAYGFTHILIKGFYFPIGMHYISKNGFTFSVEGAIINAQGSNFFSTRSKEIFPYVGIKIGFRL